MILGQRTLPWANELLGTSNFYIHAKGCLITVLAEVLGVTPDVVNARLNFVGGFAGTTDAPANKCLVIWAKISEAFPGITVNRGWSYDNDQVLNALASGNNVLVEVPATPIGGTGSHWVRYIGDHKLHDPWTGTERPTSDFPNPTGFAILSGSWVQEASAVEPVVEPTDNTYQGLDLTNTDSVKVAIDTWAAVAHGEYVKSDEYVAFTNGVCDALGIEQSSDLNKIVEAIKALKEDFAKQAQTSVVPAPEQVEGAGPAVAPQAPAVTITNLPDHEKQSFLEKIAAFEQEIKGLLGL